MASDSRLLLAALLLLVACAHSHEKEKQQHEPDEVSPAAHDAAPLSDAESGDADQTVAPDGADSQGDDAADAPGDAGVGDAETTALCGKIRCAGDERCCNRCSSTCIAKSSTASCREDLVPWPACPILPEGPACGDARCGDGQRCCDRCARYCVDARSSDVCPNDQVPPPPACPSRVPPADCKVSGESCLSGVCCVGLACQSGGRVPAGQTLCL